MRTGVAAASTIPSDAKIFPTLAHARKIPETREAVLRIRESVVPGIQPLHVTS